MTTRRILCPVDFSLTSAEALREAAELARDFGAPLEIFHVYHPWRSATAHAGAALAEQIDWIERNLAACRRDALAVGAEEVETRSAEGVPWDEIVQRASEGDFDLIVIGTRGQSGLSHLMLGSVAERVVRHAPCSVLTMNIRCVSEEAA